MLFAYKRLFLFMLRREVFAERGVLVRGNDLLLQTKKKPFRQIIGTVSL